MKRFGYILISFCSLLCACNDDPKLTFHDFTGTYSLNEQRTLEVTIDGFSITDRGGSAEFSWNGDTLATLTLTQIIPGHGTMAIGGLVVTALPGGGISFQGEMAVSETEKMIIAGSIIDGKMTLDIQRVPITAA